MAQLFSPFVMRGLTLRNRIVMSPMCMYSAADDGLATDFHLVHLVSRATGGAGLGIWDDGQIAPLARVVKACKSQGAAVAIQLAHAGRKAWTPTKGSGPEPAIAPSDLPFDADWVAPHEASIADLDGIITAYRAAVKRILRAGFDAIELHAAHGYFLHEFLSPLSNRRTDMYGGSLDKRCRMLLRVVDAVRAELPESFPVMVRLSCSDYVDGGLTIEDQVQVASMLKAHGVDAIDCSSGGNTPQAPPFGPGYQVPFAEKIRRETGLPTMAVGLITTPEMAEEIVRNERADLIVLGRELLRNPYWPLQAARALGEDIPWPKQYQRAKPVN